MKIIASLLVVAIIYWLQKKFMETIWSKELHITVQFSDIDVFEGERSLLVETIKNNKRFPVPFVHIKFATNRALLFSNHKQEAVTDQFYRNDLYNVRSYECIERKYPFIASKRGTYTITSIDVLSRDLLHTKTFFFHANSNQILYVKPRVLPRNVLPQCLINGVQTVTLKNRTFEDPFELKGIRDYQPFDNIRSINWKSTAKTGDLKVNTRLSTISHDITILIDLNTHCIYGQAIMKEYIISIAYSIAYQISKEGIKLNVVTNGIDSFTQKPYSISAGSGTQFLKNLGIGFARIDINQNCSDLLPWFSHFMNHPVGNKQYIIVTNNYNPDTTALLEKFAKRQPDSFIFIPKFIGEEDFPIAIKNMTYWEVDYNEMV